MPFEYDKTNPERLHSDDVKHFEDTYSLKDKSIAVVCLAFASPIVVTGTVIAVTVGGLQALVETGQEMYHRIRHTEHSHNSLFPYIGFK
jgi:hypothetical protein